MERMNGLPTFCLVDACKRFVPLQYQGAAGQAVEQCVVFWTEPLDAKAALRQAMQQRPQSQLAIGTYPLGRAFALCEGWAEVEGARFSFRMQAHAGAVENLRAMLERQLEQQGLPTERVFPVFLCEELTTEAQMPVFLSRAEMVATWEAAMKQAGVQAPPPAKVTVMDLKILATHMQAEGMDWRIIKFVGTDRAFAAASEANKKPGEATGESPLATSQLADPDDEPPPLISSVPSNEGASSLRGGSGDGGGRPSGVAVGGKKETGGKKKAAGKTKPNEPCPCGSGLKFKKCCSSAA